jgi:PST family polysaccharide transporter
MLKKLLSHRLAKDTLILFGVQVSGYVLPVITLPFLTRILGPANFGLTALGTALVLYFVVIVEWGFAVTGTRQIAIAQDDLDRVSRAYSTIMACKVILLMLCFVAMVALVSGVPKLRAFWPLYFVSYLQVVGFCLSPNWLLQGMQRMRFIAYSDYGAKILSVILIFVFVRRPSDYMVVAALQSGGFLISALIGLSIVFFKLRLRLVRPFFADMRREMVSGWPVFLSMASMTAMSSTNTMLVGALATTAEVGFLAAAQRLIIAVRALTNPVTTAVYPHISRLADKSPTEALHFLRRQIFWTSAPFLLISLGMLAFSPLAVHILYGTRYVESGVLLRIMFMTPVLHALAMCFGTYFMLAFGYQKEWAKIITRMVVLNFVLLFVFVKLMPPDRAVALSTVLTDLFSAASSGFFYRKTAARMLAEPPALTLVVEVPEATGSGY